MTYEGMSWQSILVAQAVVRRWLVRWRFRKQIKNSKARSRAKYEILTTERTYLKALKEARSMYQEPLLLSANESGSQRICNAEECEHMFSNLLDVIGVHERWIEELTKCYDYKSKTQPALGPVMCKLVPQLTVYAQFCDNYFIALYTYTRLKERPLFQQFLDSAAADGIMELPSFLIRPVQRIPRYILLLQELIKFTPPEHPDFKSLNEAARQLKDMTNYINERVRTAEDIKAMLEVGKKVTGTEIHQAHRRHLKDGFMTKISRKAVQRRWFILFSDTLIYCAKGAVGAAKWKGTLYLENMWIDDLKDTAKVQNGFQLVTPKKTYTVYCKTPEEKAAWVEEINDAIEAIEQRNMDDAAELQGLSGSSASKLMKLSGKSRTRIPAKERVKKQKAKRSSGFWKIFTLDPSKFDPDYFDEDNSGQDNVASEFANVNTSELAAGNYDSLAQQQTAESSEAESSAPQSRPRARTRGKTVTFDAPPEPEDEFARMDLDAGAAAMRRRQRGRAQSIAVGGGAGASLAAFQKSKGITGAADDSAAQPAGLGRVSSSSALGLDLPQTSRQKQLDEMTAMVQKYHAMLDKAEADNAHLRSLVRNQSDTDDAQSEEQRLRDIIRSMKAEADEQRERDETQIAVLRAEVKEVTRKLDAVSVENVALTRLFEDEGTKLKAVHAKAHQVTALIEQNERLRHGIKIAKEDLETQSASHRGEISIYEWRMKQLDTEYVDTIQDLRNEVRLLKGELGDVTTEMKKYRYQVHAMQRGKGKGARSPVTSRPLPRGPRGSPGSQSVRGRSSPSGSPGVTPLRTPAPRAPEPDIMVVPLDSTIDLSARAAPGGLLREDSPGFSQNLSPIPSLNPNIKSEPIALKENPASEQKSRTLTPGARSDAVIVSADLKDLNAAVNEVSSLEDRVKRMQARLQAANLQR